MSSKKSSRSKSLISKAEKAAQGIIDEKIEEIDEAIKQIEAAMRPFEKLKQKQDRLIRARDALLGGNRTTGGGGTRLRLEQVVDFIRENPGIEAQKAASELGHSYPAVYAHLNRAEGDRFLTDGKGHWWLRDPKNGFNELSDYEEEDTNG